jgi:hypothetical protein
MPAVLLTWTVVVPFGKKNPDGGLYVTVQHAPLIFAAGYVTFAPHTPVAVVVTTLLGQMMEQNDTSKEIVAPDAVTLLICKPPRAPVERKLDGFVASLIAVRPFCTLYAAFHGSPFTVTVPFGR